MNLPCGAWGLPWWLSWCKKKSTCNPGDLGSIPGLGRSPGEGNSYPLQYSGMENSMGYIVHGVAKSQTQLSDFPIHYYLKFLLGFLVAQLVKNLPAMRKTWV